MIDQDEWDEIFAEGWARGENSAFNEALQMMREEIQECESLGLDAETTALARVMWKLARLADEKFTATDRTDITP